MSVDGPQHIGEVAAAVGKMAERHAGERRGEAGPISPVWWSSSNSPEWRRFAEWFGGVSREEVAADPFDADQALREALLCSGCRASEPVPGLAGGHDDCPLGPEPWAGQPMHPGGTKNWFLVPKRIGGKDGALEWRKRRCPGRHLRQQGLKQGEYRDIGGGMRVREVEA